jgi:hypothetical protein
MPLTVVEIDHGFSARPYCFRAKGRSLQSVVPGLAGPLLPSPAVWKKDDATPSPIALLPWYSDWIPSVISTIPPAERHEKGSPWRKPDAENRAKDT